ncbi:hypothetical protein NQ317_014017 [Molorchus minor]|uniref:CBF1-interacting co-repressor CIR N-terminal domain-containing protein n=1 Tax=Molorchus minor TaxID=1323400 RepID=A0ABQ9IV85_9CUCU|nr:hypothetical protein NQ317_014017 [Molorchus minor]
MNILPKKRWHVRTKENIARVRRDEAKAAAENRVIEERTKLAEREARREILLQKSRAKLPSKEFISLNSEKEDQNRIRAGHINFFAEVEAGTAELKKSNKEHDKEQKEEREKYEKQIGYLTYLGQDTNEALAPDRTNTEKGEVNMKSKVREDPLQVMKKYMMLGKSIDEAKKLTETVKTKKGEIVVVAVKALNSIKKLREGTSKNQERRVMILKVKKCQTMNWKKIGKKRKLEVMRMQRIKRERDERKRTEDLFAKLQDKNKKKAIRVESFRPKYNSQFNPELAKQNFSDRKR